MANTFLAARGINVGKSLCEGTIFTEPAKAIELKLPNRDAQSCWPVRRRGGAWNSKPNADNETVDVTAFPADAMNARRRAEIPLKPQTPGYQGFDTLGLEWPARCL